MSSPSTSAIPLWINNTPIHTSSTFPVHRASSNTTIHHASLATPPTATSAVLSSQRAFHTWRHTPHTTRRDLLLRVASYYATHTDLFISAQISETSCTEAWARQNVTGSITYLKEIAAQVSSVTGTISPIEKPGTLGFVFKEPIGVVLCIAPWNAALILATRGIASAIAAGCTVVFKASELCPKTHFGITQAFAECGAPAGVLNQLQTSREMAAEVTETLIAHEAVRKVEFVGSAAVGRVVGQLAAKYLKPVLLELGGKCPAIVLEDADLGEATRQVAAGAVMNHGQVCFGTERVVVMDGVKEDFQEMLVREMRALGEKGVVGSAVSRDIARHAEDVLRDAREKGAMVLPCGVGGDAKETSGCSLDPTVILNPPPSSRIFDEETFGPSVSLHTVATDAEAIEVANRSAYGLNATVWTSNMARFMKIARELEYGQVHANTISVYTSATGSQGGVKGSGFGRQNGPWGLDEFVVEKFVSWCV